MGSPLLLSRGDNMEVWLYKNIHDPNKLRKEPVTIKSKIPCIIKDDTELMNPEIIVDASPEVLASNYLWLGEPFNRYYFITNKTPSQTRIYIKCHVDVLMSFQSAIEGLDVIAERASSNYDLFQIDSELPIENFSDIATKEFPTGFGNDQFLIATTGKNV